jgi:hypothetical protein
MGLVEMRDADAINYLSGCSDKYFERAMAIINRNRKEREETLNSACVKRTEELIKELKVNGWTLQFFSRLTDEWYDISPNDIRIRRKKD